MSVSKSGVGEPFVEYKSVSQIRRRKDFIDHPWSVALAVHLSIALSYFEWIEVLTTLV